MKWATSCGVIATFMMVATTSSIADNGMVPRPRIIKPAHTKITQNHQDGVISVKFRDGLRIRAWNSQLTDLGSGDLASAQPALARVGPATWKRAHSLPDEKLDALRLNAQKNLGRSIADPRVEFFVILSKGQDTATVIDGLNALEIVELAAPVEKPLPPPTPPDDYTSRQGYLNDAPAGIGAEQAWLLTGGNGNGIRICDVEYSWNLAHLDFPPVTLVGSPPSSQAAQWKDHGTNVLGEMIALNNVFGVTGASYGCSPFVASCLTGIFMNTSGAITEAVGALRSGDVILIELQIAGPHYTGVPEGTQFGLVPVEWNLNNYNSILLAVGNGVTVVEAAANGAQNLDDPIYSTGNGGHWPFLVANDSGAILVGAGASPLPGDTDIDRSRVDSSNFGATVDLQGWGQNVVTTGGGDLYSAGGENLWYTSSFNGTSSASPMVAAACAELQGSHKSAFGSVLTPAQVKAFLRSTGSSQQAGTHPVTENIGPRPNVLAAITEALNLLDCNFNHIPDSLELAGHDCNSNDNLDECDVSSGVSQDCNSNTVPDECDIANGTSEDSNGDAIPDECEGEIQVTPTTGLSASGNQGGPFSPSSVTYTVTNVGSSVASYSVFKQNDTAWVSINNTSGILSPGQFVSVMVSINANANSLSPGGYSEIIQFINGAGSGLGNTTRSVTLTVVNPTPSLSNGSVTPASGSDLTPYTFEVTYRDPSGQTPVQQYVEIQKIGGSICGGPTWCNRIMDPFTGSIATGRVYRHTTQLSSGSYRYRFHFAAPGFGELFWPDQTGAVGPSVGTPGALQVTCSSIPSGPSAYQVGDMPVLLATVRDPDGNLFDAQGVTVYISPGGSGNEIPMVRTSLGQFQSSPNTNWRFACDCYAFTLVAWHPQCSSGECALQFRPCTCPGFTPVEVSAFAASPAAMCQGSGSTLLGHSLNLDAFETLGIRSASGTVLRTLVDHAQRSAGPWSDAWDGRDDSAQPVPSGSYSAEIEAMHLDPNRTYEDFGSQGTGPCMVYQPWGLAVAPDGAVYVMDLLPTANRKIVRFSSGSPPTCQGQDLTPPIGQGAGQLNMLMNQGMAVDGQGRLHILDDVGGFRRITVWAWNGQTLQWVTEYGRSQMMWTGNYPYIAPLYYHAPSNRIYTWANDSGQSCKVFIFDATSGSLISKLDPLPGDDTNVPTATGIAVDAENNIWVSVQFAGTFVMNHSGQVLRQLSGDWHWGGCRLLIRQGRIVYTAAGDQIKVWDLRGNLLQTVSVAGSTLQQGLWLAGGSGQYLYATCVFAAGSGWHIGEWSGSRIRDFSSTDVRSTSITVTSGAPDGSPVNITPSNGATCVPADTCIDWSDVPSAVNYDVFWGTTTPPPFWQNVSVSNACPPSQDNTPYYWYVAPRGTCSQGTAGPTWSYTTGSPPTVANVAASDSAFCDKIRVSWSNAPSATGFTIWRNTTNNSITATPIGSADASPFDDTSAAAGTTYFYWVKASNVCGTGGFSNSDSGRRAAAPVAPTSVSASDGTDCGRIRVSWSGPADGSCVLIWRNGLNEFNSATVIADPCSSPFDDTDVTAGVTYYYWLQAANACGASAPAGPDSGFRKAAPSAPELASASPNPACPGESVTLSASGGANGTYTWYKSGCGSGSPIGTAPSIQVSAPSAATMYYVRIEGTCGTTACASVAVTINSSCDTGACCVNSNTCNVGVTQATCTSQGGVWQGDGSTSCESCPPVGSCYGFAWKQGSVGGGDGQFGSDTSPRGMVVVGDTLYVCDYGNNRIQWFRTSDGQFLNKKALGTYVTDIDYDPGHNRFYVRAYNRVIAYDSTFTQAWSTTIPTQSWVHYGLCVDSQGNIHTPSSYNPTIYVLDPSGQIVNQYTAPAQSPIGIESSGGFIYVACQNLGIRKYQENGTFVETVLSGTGSPALLSKLSGARMAVVFGESQQIAVYDSNWNELCRFAGAGTSDGALQAAQGIATDASDQLYTSDAGLHRIQKFGTAGSGSCCVNGNCTLTPQASCSGTWTSGGSCSPNSCPQPTGSCCVNGNCTLTTQANCPGTWIQGGTCNTNPCPQPTGSCCVGTSCTVTTQAQCSGTWTSGADCDPNPCPTGACCVGQSCQVLTQAACAAQSSTYKGDNVACGSNTCGSTTLTGACCVGASCEIRTLTACVDSGFEYRGDGTPCDPHLCGGGGTIAPPTITISPFGAGFVSLNPDLVEYPSGQILTLTATPTAGWRFTGWQGGGLSGSQNPVQITMDGLKQITALFEQQPCTDCGCGLCGVGGAGMMPLTIAGMWLMRGRIIRRRRS